MTTNIESRWIFALASKCKSLTSINFLCFLSLFVLFWFMINLFYWSHPGGPAWGKYKWTKTRRSITSMTKQNSKISIPGPKGLPIIGSMSLMSGLAHQKVSAMAETLRAKRVMAMSLGETRLIVTCNPDVAKEILNSAVFADRPVKESAYSLMFNKAIGFAPYGIYWRTLRKIASTHLFCPKQIKSSEPQRFDIARGMVAELSMKCNESVSGSIRVRDILKAASLNNIMCSVFGKKYILDQNKRGDSGSEELRKLVEEGYDLLGSMNWSDHLPVLGDLDLQRIRFRCFNLVPRVNKFVGEIIEEHRNQRNENSSPQDFVDVMLSLQGTSKLSDSDIIAVLWVTISLPL
ncbi:oxygenase [Lithospermum erythrorhizon]|uniref:Oxygenase n=1 Tax=Lithospermum erythrorhizon TaxID=34254 RepID=A0AAV3P817_LITER